MEWAMYGRKVALQNVLRAKSPEFLDDLKKKGLRVHARDAGKNFQSREERIEELVRLGIPENIATMMVDDPGKAAAVMQKLGK